MAIPVSRIHLGSSFSEGALRLWELMETKQWSIADLHRAVEMKPGTMSGWLYGDKKPSMDSAAFLRDRLGIPLEAWTQPPSRVFMLPAARLAG